MINDTYSYCYIVIKIITNIDTLFLFRNRMSAGLRNNGPAHPPSSMFRTLSYPTILLATTDDLHKADLASFGANQLTNWNLLWRA